MDGSRRISRMASAIREELMRLLLESVSDPALKDVVITEVEPTADLRQARVFFSRPSLDEMSAGEKKKVVEGFRRATPFLRRGIGSALATKYVPDLIFQWDNHPQSVSHLMNVLDSVQREGSSHER